MISSIKYSFIKYNNYFEDLLKSNKFSRIVARWNFFAIGVDPLSIYKKELNFRIRQRTYHKRELTMRVSKFDNYCQFWRKVTCFSILSCNVKFLIIAILQLLKLSFISSGSKNKTTIVMKLKWLIELFGDCLNTTPEISFLLHTFIAMFNFTVACFMPYFYSKKPIDVPPIRFLLKPNLEIRRIDLDIEDKFSYVARLIDSKRDSKLITRDNAYNPYSFRHNQLINSITSHERSRLERQLNILHKIKRFKWLFRPNIFTQGNYELLSKEVLFVIFLLYGFYAVVSIFIWPKFYQFIRDFNCSLIKRLPTSSCNIFDFYSPTQLFDLLQIVYVLINMLCHYNVLNLLINIDASNILRLVKSIKSDLNECLYKLRIINNYSNRYGESKEDYVDTVLSETLIKQLLFEDYLKQSISHLTECLYVAMLNSGIATVVTLQYRTIETTSFKGIDLILLLLSWLFLNYLILLSSFLLANISTIRKLDYSILAEIYEYSIQEGLATPTDSLTTFWTRMVHNFRVEERFSIRPFNICLNYQNVLSINFVLVSLASIILAL